MIGKVIGFGSLFVLSIVLLGYIFGAWGVFRSETDPRAVQEKYEWFKDVSATLDAKSASIDVYKQRMTDIEESYDGEPRKNWTREDREQYNVWSSEVSGLKASFNNLASEYNAQMAKWNWRFANVGGLPEGADKVLPREYKPYITE